MIPKIIHYCWMSGEPFPELIRDCIDSWKAKLPDYKIIEWNSQNFDYNIIPYTKEAMEKKKYAFVSDYVRLYALYKYGGIYLDSDIKVLKSFDSLLNDKAFTGFESKERIGVWLLASEKQNPFFKELLNCYHNRHFITFEGKLDLTPNPVILSPVFEKYGIEFNNQFQKKDLITVYPKEYFCPLDGVTGIVNITNNSYAMHLFNGAWRNKEDVLMSEIYKRFYQHLPEYFPHAAKHKLARVYSIYKEKGLKELFYQINRYFRSQV